MMILDDSAGRYTGSYRIPMFIFLMIYIFKKRNTGICRSNNVRNATVGVRREEYFFIRLTHNYTEYNQQWNLCSAFNPSKCAHTWSSGQPMLMPGEQLGVRCLAEGSHLSRGQFLPEPRFEPTTSGYKSDTLSIRATTAPNVSTVHRIFQSEWF